MRHHHTTVALIASLSFAAVATAETTFVGPSPYLCIQDSPFDTSGLGVNFFLENAEDGLINTPGLTVNGSVTGPGGITDSVDCDDGATDGSGVSGRSIFGPGIPGLTINFNGTVLGGFPTAAGVVWTDGSTFNNVTFEAFDANGVSVGTLVGLNLGDGSFNSGTAEDRFFGVYHSGGISKMTIKCQALGAGSGIEIDHIQYGAATLAPPCAADLNGDGIVNGADLGMLLAGWGAAGAADLNASGSVDGADLGLLLAAWGPC